MTKQFVIGHQKHYWKRKFLGTYTPKPSPITSPGTSNSSGTVPRVPLFQGPVTQEPGFSTSSTPAQLDSSQDTSVHTFPVVPRQRTPPPIPDSKRQKTSPAPSVTMDEAISTTEQILVPEYLDGYVWCWEFADAQELPQCASAIAGPLVSSVLHNQLWRNVWRSVTERCDQDIYKDCSYGSGNENCGVLHFQICNGWNLIYSWILLCSSSICRSAELHFTQPTDNNIYKSSTHSFQIT